MSRHRGRWSGLSVVIAFLVFATSMAVFIGTLLLFPSGLLESVWRFNPQARSAFQSMGRLASLLLFAVGAVACGGAVGIYRRRKWGWWLAVMLFSVNAFGDAVSLFAPGRMLRGAFGVLISGLFLWYLMQPKIRQQLSDQAVVQTTDLN
jgi:hypothetical protein